MFLKSHVIDTYERSLMQAGMLFHGVSETAPGVHNDQVLATLHEPLADGMTPKVGFLWTR